MIILIIAALFFIATLTIDGVVKSAIKDKGSELLQTQVDVGDVDISLLNGSGSISEFIIHNPEGFSEQPAMRIQNGRLQVEISSLLSDVIVIKELIIQSPAIFVEQQGADANLKRLSDNLDLSSDDSDKRLIIDYLLIENGTISVSTSIDRERTGEAELEQFELRDVGRDGNNTVKQTLRQVLDPLLEEAMEQALKSGVLDQLENRVRDLFNNR